jgi:hypothetical protein
MSAPRVRRLAGLPRYREERKSGYRLRQYEGSAWTYVTCPDGRIVAVLEPLSAARVDALIRATGRPAEARP